MKLFKKSIKAVGAVALTSFALFGLASCDSSANDGKEAINKISLLLTDKAENALTDDLSVPYSVKVNEKDYVVEYTTTNSDSASVETNVEEKTTTIKIKQTGEVQNFTLTAKVVEATKSWDFKIAAKDVSMIKTQAEVDAMPNLKTHAEWAAASSGTKMVIQGYVTWAHDFSASYGNASVWLQDDAGGYYGYRVKVNNKEDYDEHFAIGKKIAIDGTLSPYNGWQEMGSGCKYYYISDAAPKTYDYKDVTTLWTQNKATDEAAMAVQNQKLTVTGKVTSLPELTSSSTDGNVGISVGGNEYAVYFKTAYMSKLPTEVINSLQIGYTIKVNGFATVTKNGVQICPATAEDITITSKEVTAQDLVNGAIAEVKGQDVSSTYYESTSAPVQLKTTTTNGCTVAYALSEVKGTAITLSDDNKFAVDINYAAVSSATLTATISKEGASSKTYEWKIATKTDADVLKEIKTSVTEQSMTKSYDKDSEGNRQRLLDPTSPSSAAATVVYSVPTNDYIKVGIFEKTGQYYFDVKSIPTVDEGAKTIRLTAKITYKEKEETVTFDIVLKNTYNTWEAYYYAAAGVDLGKQTGIVTLVGVKSNQKYAMVQTDLGPIYVYNNNSKITGTDWTAKFVVGNKVTISKGKKGAYNGLQQFDPIAMNNVKVDAQAQTLPAATDISTKVSAGEDLSFLQGALVSVTGTAVVDGTKFYIQVGEKKILVREDTTFATLDLKTNFTHGSTEATVTGFLGWYNGAQICPLTLDNFDEPAPVTHDVELDCTGDGAYLKDTTSEVITSKLTDNTDLVITAYKNDCSNSSGYVNFHAGSLRVYEKASLTVASSTKTIKSITFTFDSSKKGPAFYVNGVKVEAVNGTVTINAGSVDIKAEEGQVRFLTLFVDFAA